MSAYVSTTSEALSSRVRASASSAGITGGPWLATNAATPDEIPRPSNRKMAGTARASAVRTPVSTRSTTYSPNASSPSASTCAAASRSSNPKTMFASAVGSASGYALLIRSSAAWRSFQSRETNPVRTESSAAPARPGLDASCAVARRAPNTSASIGTTTNTVASRGIVDLPRERVFMCRVDNAVRMAIVEIECEQIVCAVTTRATVTIRGGILAHWAASQRGHDPLY